MIRTTAIACLMSAALVSPVFAQQSEQAPNSQQIQQSQTSQVPQQTHKFLNTVAESNQSEIRAGVLAEKQAANPAVKAFARLMVDDHMALESQLATVLGKMQVSVSNGITPQAQKEMPKLEQVSGHQFDTEYMKAQIQAHQHAIQQFEQEKKSAQNPEVRALIDGSLPILKQHLALAQSVDQTLTSGSNQNVAQR